jgi:hypothetical protein
MHTRERLPKITFLFPYQASEFFMFGVLMVVDMVLFAFLAFRFQNAEAAAKKAAEGIDNLALDSLPLEERKKPVDEVE